MKGDSFPTTMFCRRCHGPVKARKRRTTDPRRPWVNTCNVCGGEEPALPPTDRRLEESRRARRAQKRLEARGQGRLFPDRPPPSKGVKP